MLRYAGLSGVISDDLKKKTLGVLGKSFQVA
jgi:hypothetical protein